MNIQSSSYQKAFHQYLRKGTPIHLSLKADNPKEGYYIWRTVGDDKVRSRHTERDGEVFNWNNPPEGGHPGEDYGCRCWAENYTPHRFNPETDDPTIEPVYPIETLIGIFVEGAFYVDYFPACIEISDTLTKKL